MKKIILITLIFSCLGCFAQVESEYEKYVREQNEKMQQMKQDQDEGIKKMQKEYEDYVKAEQEAYNKFVKEREEKWGKGNVKESTQTDWVEYTDNGNVRTKSVFNAPVGEFTGVMDVIVYDLDYATMKGIVETRTSEIEGCEVTVLENQAKCTDPNCKDPNCTNPEHMARDE